jgi:hypothetical protein
MPLRLQPEYYDLPVSARWLKTQLGRLQEEVATLTTDNARLSLALTKYATYLELLYKGRFGTSYDTTAVSEVVVSDDLLRSLLN